MSELLCLDVYAYMVPQIKLLLGFVTSLLQRFHSLPCPEEFSPQGTFIS